jgi:hypothetical protein
MGRPRLMALSPSKTRHPQKNQGPRARAARIFRTVKIVSFDYINRIDFFALQQ